MEAQTAASRDLTMVVSPYLLEAMTKGSDFAEQIVLLL